MKVWPRFIWSRLWSHNEQLWT